MFSIAAINKGITTALQESISKYLECTGDPAVELKMREEMAAIELLVLSGTWLPKRVKCSTCAAGTVAMAARLGPLLTFWT